MSRHHKGRGSAQRRSEARASERRVIVARLELHERGCEEWTLTTLRALDRLRDMIDRSNRLAAELRAIGVEVRRTTGG